MIFENMAKIATNTTATICTALGLFFLMLGVIDLAVTFFLLANLILVAHMYWKQEENAKILTKIEAANGSKSKTSKSKRPTAKNKAGGSRGSRVSKKPRAKQSR